MHTVTSRCENCAQPLSTSDEPLLLTFAWEDNPQRLCSSCYQCAIEIAEYGEIAMRMALAAVRATRQRGCGCNVHIWMHVQGLFTHPHVDHEDDCKSLRSRNARWN